MRRLHPHAVRLIFSGCRDFEAATAAINQGAVYKFLLKPYDDGELCETVADAFARYDRKARAAGELIAPFG